MNVIAFTKINLPYGWLGNMAPYPVVYEGKRYRTTEALFQCLRFKEYPEVQEAIRECASPMGAKMVAKKNRALADCTKDIENMKLCLELKLEQHPQLKTWLLLTKDAILIEDVTKRMRSKTAMVWGAAKVGDSWVGNNLLGELWMEIRNSLQD